MKVLVGAVEEAEAEWSALAAGDSLVEELDTRRKIFFFILDALLVLGKDTQSSLQGVDAVDIEQSQTFLTEEDLVLSEGLFNKVVILELLASMLVKSVRPALTEGVLLSSLFDDLVEDFPCLCV